MMLMLSTIDMNTIPVDIFFILIYYSDARTTTLMCGVVGQHLGSHKDDQPEPLEDTA